MAEQTTYQRLATPFEYTFQDERGGRSFDYITGEQCVSRLNEVLGPGHWSFRVLEHGIDGEGDEAWALGEIQAVIDGELVVRQQFGSNAIKRSRATGAPISLGDDRKAASTDALKKCASWIGIALYLSHKTPQQNGRVAPRAQRPAEMPSPRPQADPKVPTPIAAIRCRQPTGELDEQDRPLVCNAPLTDVPEKGWTAVQLANAHPKRPLCWSHFQQVSNSEEQRSTG